MGLPTAEISAIVYVVCVQIDAFVIRMLQLVEISTACYVAWIMAPYSLVPGHRRFWGDPLPPVALEMEENVPQKRCYLPTRLHVVATEMIII